MITLSEVKTFLWITWNDDNIRLQAILDSINEEITRNVWDLSLGEKTMMVKNSAVKNWTITLNIINPTDITEINGADFSWKVKWVDYIIKSDWEALIKDLSSYSQNDFGSFEVKFNAWYTDTPKSLIRLASNYLAYLYSQDMWKDIVQEQLWPRWVTYSDNNWTDWVWEARKRFKLGLSAYIPLALKIY